MNAITLFFDFRGRIDRTRYWIGLASLFVGVPAIAVAVAMFIYYALLSGIGAQEPIATSVILLIFMGGLALLAGLVLNICVMALTAKRLHDVNSTGLWCLVFFFAPSPLSALFLMGSQMLGQSSVFGIHSLFAGLGGAVLVAMVILGCLPTRPGPNQYDFPPSPLPNTPPPPEPDLQPHPRAFPQPQARAPEPVQRTGFGKRPSQR